jgi:uncharacterized protein YlxW (UPF0749 family)
MFRGVVAAAVVAIVAAGAAWQQRNHAIDEARRADAQRALAEERRREAERQTTLADQSAKDLAAALAEVRANLIWSRLEFRTDDLQPYEVGAIWDLVTGRASDTGRLSEAINREPCAPF